MTKYQPGPEAHAQMREGLTRYFAGREPDRPDDGIDEPLVEVLVNIARELARIANAQQRDFALAPPPDRDALEQARADYDARSAQVCRLGRELARAESRAASAEARLANARHALLADGYFTPEEVCDDLAPRITEWLAHHRSLLEEQRDEHPCCDPRSNRP